MEKITDSIDIKQMLLNSYHEIYDKPLDESQLISLFDDICSDKVKEKDKNSIKVSKNTTNFDLSSISYTSSSIPSYIDSFMTQIKYSLNTPVMHYMPNHTKFDEVNDMLYKFNFIVNLYYIKKNYEESVENQQVGVKRKMKSEQKCKCKVGLVEK